MAFANSGRGLHVACARACVRAFVCVRACVRACERASVRARVRMCFVPADCIGVVKLPRQAPFPPTTVSR